MKLGTLTVTGYIPLGVDGLSLGWSRDKHRMVFQWTTEGFARKNKLYKTQDPCTLISTLGIGEATYSLKIDGSLKA